MLLDRLPRGRVLAVDAAPSMVEQARENLDDRATVWQSDLVELEVPEPVDAVFSNAVFHWVPDHDTLFARLHAALKPGGQMVVQCGGQRQHRALPRARARGGGAGSPTPGTWAAGRDRGTSPPPSRPGPGSRPRASATSQTWLEESPMVPPEPETYLRVVCLGHHLEALPEELREPYTRDVLERCGDPVELDYVRLNILARA